MNLPNKLTVGRIVMVPIMIACFFIPRDIVPYWNYIAAGVFIVAFITDILDGAIARKQNIVSDFGKLMDPIADKLLTASALIMLVSEGMLGPLGSIMTIVIIAREFLVSGIRMVAAAKGRVIAAGKLGKLKTISQAIALSLVMMGNPVFSIIDVPMDMIVLYISVGLTVTSGVEYTAKNKQVFAR